MGRLVLWAVVGVVMAVVGYSALAASRAREGVPPPAPSPEAPSPCWVVSYDLAPNGRTVQAVVVCRAAGQYRVAVEAEGEGQRGSGQVVARLPQDAPTVVSIPLSSPLPPDASSYRVRFEVTGM